MQTKHTKHTKHANSKKQQGFTLIEVMIALVIAVVSITALMKATSQTTGNMHYFVNKTLSNIVAGNLVVETRILGAPKPGYTDKKYYMAGKNWYYRIHTTNKKILLLETIRTTSDIFVYEDLKAQQNKEHIAKSSLSFFKNHKNDEK